MQSERPASRDAGIQAARRDAECRSDVNTRRRPIRTSVVGRTWEVESLEPKAKATDDAGEANARKRGRRATMTAYYSVVVTFILLAAGNVSWQVWVPALRSYPPVDCKDGLRELIAGVERAREAAGGFAESG